MRRVGENFADVAALPLVRDRCAFNKAVLLGKVGDDGFTPHFAVKGQQTSIARQGASLKATPFGAQRLVTGAATGFVGHA